MTETKAERAEWKDSMDEDIEAANGLFVVFVIVAERIGAMLADAARGDKAAMRLAPPVLELTASLAIRPQPCAACRSPVDACSKYYLAVMVPASDAASKGLAAVICERCTALSDYDLERVVRAKLRQIWPSIRVPTPAERQKARSDGII